MKEKGAADEGAAGAGALLLADAAAGAELKEKEKPVELDAGVDATEGDGRDPKESGAPKLKDGRVEGADADEEAGADVGRREAPKTGAAEALVVDPDVENANEKEVGSEKGTGAEDSGAEDSGAAAGSGTGALSS